MRRLHLFSILALAAVPAAGQPVNPAAKTLSEFQQRVEGYLELRERASAGLPKLEETKSPAEVTARQQALARAIKKARAGAHPGDLFFPGVAELIKKAIREDLRQRPAPERAAAVGSVPTAPAIGINDAYPSSIPLATVPPKLLARLPKLPDELEYRFLGSRLILRDVDANLVVDFVDAALPRSS